MTQAAMSHPNDWAQFYRHISFSGQPSLPSDVPPPPEAPDLLRSPDPTALSASSTATPVPGTNPTAGTALTAGGRVTKPKRRRSRASRRTPTTLLSTDTTNFRAMVQQFTGGPGAQFLAAAGPRGAGALNINFGVDPAGRAQVGHPPGLFQHVQNPLLQQLVQNQRPAFSHVADQNVLSLERNSSPEFPLRPPFMQQ